MLRHVDATAHAADGEARVAGSPGGRLLAAAGKRLINLWDDNGEQLHILKKLHPDRKFDGQMAAVLSWEAYLKALKANAKPRRRRRTKPINRRP